MPATIRIDFDVHAEAIGKALQAELAKVQGVSTQINEVIKKIHEQRTQAEVVQVEVAEEKKKSVRVKKSKEAVQTSIQEEQQGFIAKRALTARAEQEIAEMRASFSAKVWGSEKKAAQATTDEIQKMMERKDVIRRSLEDASLDESVKAEMETEKKKLEINLATMRRIALENKEIREHGAGGIVGMLGQGRNIDEINIKATKLKTLFGSGLGIAAVAVSMGVFSKSTGEAVDQVGSVAAAGLGMAASIGGVAKAVLTAAQAQKVLNVAMAAAPWAAAIAAIGLVIGYWDEITEALESAWEWVKKAYAAFNEFFESLGPLGTALKYLVAPITLVIDGVSALVGLFSDASEGNENVAESTGVANQAIAEQARKVRTAATAWNEYNENLQNAIDYNLGTALQDPKLAEGAKALAKLQLQQLNERKAQREAILKEISGEEVEIQRETGRESARVTKESTSAQMDSHVLLYEAIKKQAEEQARREKELADEQLRRLQERVAILLEVAKIEADGEAEQMRRLSERIALQVEVNRIIKEGEDARKRAFQEQVQQYTQIGQSIFSLIGAIKDLSKEEHKRDEAADERLQKQLAAHEQMSENNAGLAKDEKEAQAIRKKGEDQRSKMLADRNAEEDEAARKEQEAAARQNTANLLQAGSAMVVAVANGIAAGASGGPLALLLIPSIVGMILATFASAKSGLGFRKGGYTGDGREDEEAGVVHKKEFVLPAGTFARDSQGKIISIDPSLIAGSSNNPSESIRMGGFINLTGDKGQKADESIRMGGFINVMEENNKLLRQVLASRNSGRRSRIMLTRSLNRESV